jgi:NADH-quinone oxidoreductase subunit I
MSYFENIWSGIKTTAQGLSLTKQYFFKKGVYTIQYPEETLPIDPVTHRGIHEYDVDRCISCLACAKACPVECIYIESAPDAKGKPTKGKAAIMTRYDIDYSKCLFCGLCVPPCPSECIQLGERYSLPGHTRDDMVVHFHEGGYPIAQKTELATEMIAEFNKDNLYEKKRAERAALGIPTLRPVE